MELQQESRLCFGQPQIHVPAHLPSRWPQFPRGCGGFAQDFMPQPVFEKEKAESTHGR